MRILLVEDDIRLGPLVEYKLAKQLHSVDWVTDGGMALDYMEAARYDLFILDWMLPGKTGLELCQEARSRNLHTPILMLTARDAVPDRVSGLLSGADDYLVKPFAFEELLARIQVLARRMETDWTSGIYRISDLVVNMQTFEVLRQDIPVTLTRREFQLLAYLVMNAGQVLSRQQIMDQVWGLSADITPNAVDATVKLLRKKIDGPYESKLIQSIRGFGFRLIK